LTKRSDLVVSMNVGREILHNQNAPSIRSSKPALLSVANINLTLVKTFTK